jgi:hypothetical protein
VLALDQQNQHAAEVEKSRVQSIEFRGQPGRLKIAPGCILKSETFGDRWKVIRYSEASMIAEVEPG